MANHEKSPRQSSHKRPVLAGNLLLFLGAIAGSASAFWSYKALLGRFSIIFPVAYILACLIVSAFSGIGVTSVADKHDRLRWIALMVTIFIGVMVPICAYLILSFLAGPT